MCIDGGTPNHATFFPCRLLVMVIWRPAVLKAYRYLQNWLKAMNSAANRNCPCFHSRGELRAQALSRARKFAKVVLNAHFTFIWPKWSFNGDNDNMIILHIYNYTLDSEVPIVRQTHFQTVCHEIFPNLGDGILFCSCPQPNPTWSPLTLSREIMQPAFLSHGSLLLRCLTVWGGFQWTNNEPVVSERWWNSAPKVASFRFGFFGLLFEYVWVLLWSLLLELPKTYKNLHRSFPRWRQVAACSVTSFVAIVRTSLHLGFVWK